VVVIAINVKEPRETVAAWVKEQGLTMPVWIDTDGSLAPRFAPDAPGVGAAYTVVNAHFVVDRDGLLRYAQLLDMAKFDAQMNEVIENLERLADPNR
jgi:peroxiredoxin